MSEWKDNKLQILARLRRAEGQVRAVINMVDREDDCAQVAQQLAAARKALDRSFFDMMACMMQRELETAGHAPATMKKVNQLNELLARYG
jgi:DNA-binding FrmR family transcriptional regulator